MTLTLGGPGVACSAMTLRRLAAGELSGAARARAEAHLAGCARCQAAAREQEAERRALAAELPFEAFAAGVAERLAAAGARDRRPPPAWRRALPLALAASLAAVAVPLASRLGPFEGAGDGTRIKGRAAATLHVREGEGSRPLRPGEPVPAGAPLRLSVSPGGHAFAAAALLDEDGPALLSSGPAAPGQLTGAFEWTGRRGLLVVVVDHAPVDGEALLGRLRAGGAAAASPGGAAEVVVLPLSRSGP
jgi:hypothetical protein